MRALLVCIFLVLNASPATARDAVGLAAPEKVRDSGLLDHILPRFSLKTAIRVVSDPDGPMRLGADGDGIPVFRRDGVTYRLETDDSPEQVRFRDWMLSEIGKTTIESFQPDGATPFIARFDPAPEADTAAIEGNARRGADLSLTLCGRCHVIGPQNRMKGLGSTPSFAVLRSLGDWLARFREFYVRKPHGAFTQVAEVTPPFDPERPSPIVPIEMTLADLDAIIAFVSTTAAADLGAPLQTQ